MKQWRTGHCIVTVTGAEHLITQFTVQNIFILKIVSILFSCYQLMDLVPLSALAAKKIRTKSVD